jgi:hypothetical protein
MRTLRETVMAFQTRKIRFTSYSACKTRKRYWVTLFRTDQFIYKR